MVLETLLNHIPQWFLNISETKFILMFKDQIRYIARDSGHTLDHNHMR